MQMCRFEPNRDQNTNMAYNKKGKKKKKGFNLRRTYE